MSNLSRTIADHIAGTEAQALPTTTLHATRRALLDALGVMLGATGLSNEAKPYHRYASGIAGQSRLLGSNARSSPGPAALANGALSHALDFGDTFDAGPAHPNAALVPALLALCDADPQIDLERFLLAMTLGSDLACRLSCAPSRPFEEGGWYPPPLVNLVATAAGCAKLLGLDAEGIVHAMGLAMMQATFPGEIKYDAASPVRGIREGFAARGAVEGALLAADGARSFVDPLGGKEGFFTIYGGGRARPALTTDLGRVFLGDQVSFKPWPACRGTHAYIEAALLLRPEIEVERIERIEAEIGPVQEMLIRPKSIKAAPRSATDARFSIPFTLAAALIDGEVSLATFLPERLGDDAIIDLAGKVVEKPNPEWGRAEAATGSVTIILRGGRRLSHHVGQAAGHPDRPLGDEALLEKFVACSRFAASPPGDTQARKLGEEILRGAVDRSASLLLR